MPRGGTSGRGGPPRGGGRGGSSTGSGNTASGGSVVSQSSNVGEVKTVPPRGDFIKPVRGGHYNPRGRGSYQNASRQLTGPPQSNSLSQGAPVPPIKRGAPGGPPGPKRGRYDQGPNRQIPLHHGPPSGQIPPHASQHVNSYNNSSAPVQSKYEFKKK